MTKAKGDPFRNLSECNPLTYTRKVKLINTRKGDYEIQDCSGSSLLLSLVRALRRDNL